MPGKAFNFAQMTAFNFNNIGATSTNNCFGCDVIGCDALCDSDECDSSRPCDMSQPDPAYEPKKTTPVVEIGKFENASEKDLLESIAISLERIAAAAEYRNKILTHDGVKIYGNW